MTGIRSEEFIFWMEKYRNIFDFHQMPFLQVFHMMTVE